MSKKTLYTAWGGMFILCACLGFIPEPEGLLKALMVLASILFFLPPALLLRAAVKAGDKHTLRLIRSLSILSLAGTLVLLIGNILSALGSELLGNVLHVVLGIVSSPMFCGQYWAVSLFLWACLMVFSISRLARK